MKQNCLPTATHWWGGQADAAWLSGTALLGIQKPPKGQLPLPQPPIAPAVPVSSQPLLPWSQPTDLRGMSNKNQATSLPVPAGDGHGAAFHFCSTVEGSPYEDS